MNRISVPVDPALFKRMQRLFPWGTQAAVVRRLCELVCNEIEKEGLSVIELLISGRFNPIPEDGKRVRIK